MRGDYCAFEFFPGNFFQAVRINYFPFVFLQGLTGTTVGKMVMGIKLINNQGDKVGLWDSLVRWIGYYLSVTFLFIGFLWSLFDQDSQTWHDKIAGTYVVKD